MATARVCCAFLCSAYAFLVCMLPGAYATIAVTVGPNKQALKGAESVVLPCQYTSDDAAPTVRWWKEPDIPGQQRARVYHVTNGQAFTGYDGRTEIVDQASLKLLNLGMQDEGTYVCSVEKDADYEEGSVRLEILVAPNPPSISSYNPPLEADNKRQVVARCTSEGGKPEATLSWYNGSQLISGGLGDDDDDQGGTLIQDRDDGTFNIISDLIVALSRYDQGQQYFCQVDHPALDQPQKEFIQMEVLYPVDQVTVTTSAVTTREGDTVTLTCSADSNPPAELTWTRASGGDSLPNNSVTDDTSLTLTNLGRTDSGDYTCTARNVINGNPYESSKNATVNVLYAPVILQPPSPSLEVQAKQPLNVLCTADGNPPPKVVWQKDGDSKPLPNPLQFNSVDYSVEGTYKCVASSSDPSFSEAMATTMVDVKGAPSVQVKPQDSLAAIMGDTATIECTILSDPSAQNIYWTYTDDNGQNQTVSSGNGGYSVAEEDIADGKRKSTLTINNVNSGHLKVYNCIAENNMGTSSQAISVLEHELNEIPEPTPTDVYLTTNRKEVIGDGLERNAGPPSSVAIVIVLLVLILIAVGLGAGVWFAKKKGFLKGLSGGSKSNGNVQKDQQKQSMNAIPDHDEDFDANHVDAAV
ncbi:PREDICTED: carcinoembryonic antigen-related cell adhesion molecule 1-like isoform X2 [Branchiostoma belcheri]|uniref:Carcinoembryonic antigen-related cell adhesion molecule 1-like isoform X2 n=1 Tax=Branchiostoma belcheri TaxID=7741 RepID=A0A6P4YXV8_BRABE|nr:PREDICTED: carcinoembryonic antigen-related cell adhesion molecule 1-like isoform X2 [Branchiostoma belcheri]